MRIYSLGLIEISNSKQQSLTHLNCDVPYVIGNEWEDLSRTSTLGVKFAEDDGEIIYNKHDLLIENYPKLKKVNVERLPPIKKTASIFGSMLRHSLPAGKKFKKDDIIFEYDCFTDGIPTSGYNCNTMYTPFFGFNQSWLN